MRWSRWWSHAYSRDMTSDALPRPTRDTVPPHQSGKVAFLFTWIELRPSKQQPQPSHVPTLGCRSLPFVCSFLSHLHAIILAHISPALSFSRFCARTIPFARLARPFASSFASHPTSPPSIASPTTLRVFARSKLDFHSCTAAKMDSDSVFSDGGDSDGYMPEPVSITAIHLAPPASRRWKYRDRCARRHK